MNEKIKVIVITGGSGSGKSEFAKWFKKALVIELDSFYKPLKEVPKDSAGHPDFDVPEAVNVAECAAMVKELIKKGNSTIPVYSMLTNDRDGRRKIQVSKSIRFIVVEGIFSFYSPLRELADLKIFLDTPTEARAARRMIRDVKRKGKSSLEIMSNFIRVEKNYLKYVEPMKRYADLIVPFSYNPIQFVK